MFKVFPVGISMVEHADDLTMAKKPGASSLPVPKGETVQVVAAEDCVRRGRIVERIADIFMIAIRYVQYNWTALQVSYSLEGIVFLASGRISEGGIRLQCFSSTSRGPQFVHPFDDENWIVETPIAALCGSERRNALNSCRSINWPKPNLQSRSWRFVTCHEVGMVSAYTRDKYCKFKSVGSCSKINGDITM